MRWSDFSTITRQMTLSQPTNEVDSISGNAIALFKKEWKTGEPIRLLGVGVSSLAAEQLSLWDRPAAKKDYEADERLNKAVRNLREKFGDEVLKWGDDAEKSNT